MAYFIIAEVKDAEEKKIVQQDDEGWESIKHISYARIKPLEAQISIRRLCQKNNSHMFRYALTVGSEMAKLIKMEDSVKATVMFNSKNPFRIKVQKCTDPNVKSLSFTKNSLSPNSRIQFRRDWSHQNFQLNSSHVEIEDFKDGEIIVNFEQAVKQYGY